MTKRKEAPAGTGAEGSTHHTRPAAYSPFVGRLGEALKVADTPAGRATAKIGELANG
jgi:hypothetical protein